MKRVLRPREILRPRKVLRTRAQVPWFGGYGCCGGCCGGTSALNYGGTDCFQKGYGEKSRGWTKCNEKSHDGMEHGEMSLGKVQGGHDLV